MKAISKFLGGTIFALALSACGGGGGGGNGSASPATPPPVSTPDQKWLTLTPSSVELSQYAGEVSSISIIAKSSKTFAKRVNIGIIDPAGVFNSEMRFSALSDLEYRAELETSRLLAAGRHSVNLELRLCEDDPKVCKAPLAGSPWLIPVTVNVRAEYKLTTLADLPNVPTWSTFQGNAAHTGHVPASFDVSKFTRRWVMPTGSMFGSTIPLAHENGRAFAVLSGYSAPSHVLLAISEETGKELWRVDFGSVYRVNPPAAANGKVYLTTTGYGDGFYWVFDQETGRLVSKTGMYSQWWQHLAPTVYGDGVYTSSSGMTKFSATSSEEVWFSSEGHTDDWTPAVDNAHAYSYVAGRVYAIAAGDGTTAFSIADPDDDWRGYTGTTLVLSGSRMAFVIRAGRLLAFDLAARKFAWKANGMATGIPAVANDVVYAPNSRDRVLQAHAATTGALLWTSELPGDGPYTQLVVTNNLAFVGSAWKTVAIDLATQRKVWEYPLGGELSISNRGVLYIGGLDGKIVAFNLQ